MFVLIQFMKYLSIFLLPCHHYCWKQPFYSLGLIALNTYESRWLAAKLKLVYTYRKKYSQICLKQLAARTRGNDLNALSTML